MKITLYNEVGETQEFVLNEAALSQIVKEFVPVFYQHTREMKKKDGGVRAILIGLSGMLLAIGDKIVSKLYTVAPKIGRNDDTCIWYTSTILVGLLGKLEGKVCELDTKDTQGTCEIVKVRPTTFSQFVGATRNQEAS